MAKLLMVVHRYAPYPGGSENHIRDMAQEMLSRGHDVTVLTHTHKGDLNGVKVTSDYERILLHEKWDLIIVHGGDVISQDIVHLNGRVIPSPVLYLIIKPSGSHTCVGGLEKHKFIGYSTSEDIAYLKHFDRHIRVNGVSTLAKARRVRYGLNHRDIVVGQLTFTAEEEKKTVFVSAGGFSPHKAMIPLADAFERANIPNAELHLYGYGEGELPLESNKVKVFFGKPRIDVLTAIAKADAYIMNSYEEGFGLVLVEAMMNMTPWFARNIAGARLMAKYGNLYETEDELMEKLRNFTPNVPLIKEACEHALREHSIVATCDDIEDVLIEQQWRTE